MVAPKRNSERRSERLLTELLVTQGWNLSGPPRGDLLLQHEYRHVPALAEILRFASKSGAHFGVPEAILVDRQSLEPLLIVEAKAEPADIDIAVHEVTEIYARPCIRSGFNPLAIALAGTSEESFALRVYKWTGTSWKPVTYDGEPIGWIPNRQELDKIRARRGETEIRPSVPPPDVLANRADEINRLLREANINDTLRPGVVGAIMLALWGSKGDIRRSEKHILEDINRACEQAFWQANKRDLSKSLHVDEANQKLAVKARRIVTILELLNVTVLTAEHDYLGQLYETFFRYTGGNTIGQYFTPRHVAAMMAELCQVGSADIVLDPACGTGGFLVAAMDRIQRSGRLSRAQTIQRVQRQLIGFEAEPITAALAVANMIVRGDGSTSVHRGDCFTDPNYPKEAATVALMNPPFPHEATDVPPERFVEQALVGLQVRGQLAVILPTSALVKSSTGPWREKILARHSLMAVCQLPDELFQPYASSTTSIVVLEKGVPHSPRRKTCFVRMQYDGFTLKKGIRVPRGDGKNQIAQAVRAIINREETPGFSGLAGVGGAAEWGVGKYIPSAPASEDEIQDGADVLIRRLASFYVRYAREVVRQREAIDRCDLELVAYRELVSGARQKNAESLPAEPGTIGGLFDIYYGMKELHSRDGIPPGDALVISPTEEYNGCYGWLDFNPISRPPFVTVAQTGSIGEAFVQTEPCAVNDDCLVLLPKQRQKVSLARLVIAAATLHSERWRFTYGRKLTPQRICEFQLPNSVSLEKKVSQQLRRIAPAIGAALVAFGGEERPWY